MTTYEDDLKNEMTALKEIFQGLGYPGKFVVKAITGKKRQEPEGEDQDNQRQQEYVSIPYVKAVSERIRRVLSNHGLKVARSSKITLNVC